MSYQEIYDYTLEEPSPSNFLTTSPSDLRDINLRRENDEALKAIQRIILIEEDTPSAVDKYEAAIASLQGKLALNPENVAALVGLTYFLNKLGREAVAVEAAGRILAITPSFSAADFENTLRLKFRTGPMNNAALLKKAGFE